jgi:thiamine-monophosphate kinase
VVVAAGDDAAVLMGAGDVVLSTDTLVSGADFRTDWSSGADVGVKAAAAALADVAAMGARPVALLVSLTVPGGTDLDWVLDLATGLAEESARAGADVVGGDVAAGREIVVTGTASGRLPVGSSPVLRSGAAAGDIVALAGRLGDSRAGLALLERYGSQVDTFGDQALQVLAAHRRPRPPYAAGPAA